jgi:hypothetical protein
LQRYGKKVLPSMPPIPRELERKGVVLAIARAHHPPQKIHKRAGLTERIGPEYLYPTCTHRRAGVPLRFSAG